MLRMSKSPLLDSHNRDREQFMKLDSEGNVTVRLPAELAQAIDELRTTRARRQRIR
jgi:hypothetical protein